ncbi:MAG: TRAP transporter small permease subunit [Thiolinea sp.]
MPLAVSPLWGTAFIVAIMFYEVVMRYLFFKPALWVNEMSLWVGGVIYVTAGLTTCMQQRSHIRTCCMIWHRYGCAISV